MRRTEGIFPDIPANEYHEGAGAPGHSLSSSLAARLLRQSPAHAFAYCPTGGGVESESTDGMEFGTAVHQYVLVGVEGFHVVEANDWRTNAAKAEREAAHGAGLIPVLSGKMERIRVMAAAIRKQIGAFEEQPRPLSDGIPESTLIWCEKTQHGDIWCRARPDWLRNDHSMMEDLKTSANAEPSSWIRRQLFGMDYDLQAAFYQRGLKALTGKDAQWRFVVAETEQPHSVSVVGLAPSAIAHASDKVEQCVQTWAKCCRADNWPGYPRRTAYAEPPAWEVAQWTEQMERVDE